MKSYKAVFLDWDDTIGDFKNAAYHAILEIYAKYGISRLYDDANAYFAVYNAHNLELWHEYGDDKVTKEFLAHDRFYWPMKQSPKSCGFADEDLHKMADVISEDFLVLTTKYFRLLPDAEETIKYLAAKYPLTIVSNGFIEVQYEKIRRSGLGQYFTHVVLSEEIGCQKPNPLFFQKALEVNHISAEDAIVVGDSYYSDIQGAINAGIDYIWLTDGKTIKDVMNIL